MRTDKIIVIVGPTASGKTEVGVRLAEEIGGEIISADSRAIYRGMDIGTAKPSSEEQSGIPHWGIDLVNPDQRYTVADFKEYAEQKILEIQSRGKLPIIVGGTGLYVDALIYDYKFNAVVKNTQADRAVINNKFVQVGILVDRGDLRVKITKRVELMLNEEIEAETKKLAQKYDWSLQPMRSNIYPIVWRMMKGEIDLTEAKRLAVKKDMDLAKRQMTWFRRNKQIKWMKREDVVDYVTHVLQF